MNLYSFISSLYLWNCTGLCWEKLRCWMVHFFARGSLNHCSFSRVCKSLIVIYNFFTIIFNRLHMSDRGFWRKYQEWEKQSSGPFLCSRLIIQHGIFKAGRNPNVRAQRYYYIILWGLSRSLLFADVNYGATSSLLKMMGHVSWSAPFVLCCSSPFLSLRGINLFLCSSSCLFFFMFFYPKTIYSCCL